MKKNIERIILLILLLGTMTIIFGFSSQDGKESGNISKKITEQIVKRIPQIQEKEQEEKEIIINRIEKVIRKIAHFSIYTVVGILVMAFISTYQIKEKNRIIISTIIGIIYACSDEIHQSLVPGRSPMITDVMIDTMGVVLGILLVMLGKVIIKNFQKKIYRNGLKNHFFFIKYKSA